MAPARWFMDNPITVRTAFLTLGVLAGLWVALTEDDAVKANVRIGIIMGVIAGADLMYGQQKAKEDREQMAREAAAQGRRLDRLDGKVDEVHRATNGMKDALVAKAEQAGREQGRAEEKARTETERQPPPAEGKL